MKKGLKDRFIIRFMGVMRVPFFVIALPVRSYEASLSISAKLFFYLRRKGTIT